MLVCNDLEKLRKYGFKKNVAEYPDGGKMYYYERFVKNNSNAYVDEGENIIYISGMEDTNATDLDFIYDMIKDGILEKVEE